MVSFYPHFISCDEKSTLEDVAGERYILAIYIIQLLAISVLRAAVQRVAKIARVHRARAVISSYLVYALHMFTSNNVLIKFCFPIIG